MEIEFDVNSIKQQMEILIPQLSLKPYFPRYAELLRDVIVRRSIIEASIKYVSISINELFELINFSEPMNMNSWDVEKALLHAAVEDYVSFDINHENKIITFVKDPY